MLKSKLTSDKLLSWLCVVFLLFGVFTIVAQKQYQKHEGCFRTSLTSQYNPSSSTCPRQKSHLADSQANQWLSIAVVTASLDGLIGVSLVIVVVLRRLSRNTLDMTDHKSIDIK